MLYLLQELPRYNWWSKRMEKQSLFYLPASVWVDSSPVPISGLPQCSSLEPILSGPVGPDSTGRTFRSGTQMGFLVPGGKTQMAPLTLASIGVGDCHCPVILSFHITQPRDWEGFCQCLSIADRPCLSTVRKFTMYKIVDNWVFGEVIYSPFFILQKNCLRVACVHSTMACPVGLCGIPNVCVICCSWQNFANCWLV